MEFSSSRILELEKELSEFTKKLEKEKEKSKKLELEINSVKHSSTMENFILDSESQFVKESRDNLKQIHEAYQKLSKQSTAYLQYAIMDRLEELYQEKERLQSQLEHLEFKRSIEKAKLQEIKLKLTAQNNKKKAMILKLKKNCEKSEAARREAMATLMELKNKQ